MDDSEIDALISAGAPEGAEADEDVALGVLRDYREGRLDAEAAAAVEAQLARDPELRGLVLALAEPAPNELKDWAVDAWPGGVNRRRWFALAGAGVAATTAAAATLLFLRADPPRAYDLEGPFGGRSVDRDGTKVQAVFDANSQVRLVLRPEAAGAESAAALFQIRDGRLVARAAKIEGGQAAIRVTGSGLALFGDTPGRVEIAVGVAADADALDLDGVRWSEAEDRSVHWIRFAVRYEVP